MSLIQKITSIFGNPNDRKINKLKIFAEEVGKHEAGLLLLSDEALREKTLEFKGRLSAGESLDDIKAEAFAVMREAGRRVISQRHFDTQLIGGAILHEGAIAEMRTGEGKTLVATLPTYLNALTGKGVHVVTVNDYLARRDGAWMGRLYDALGLTVSCINHDSSYIFDSGHIDKEATDSTEAFKVQYQNLRPITRREAYEADITYGTNNEYGFDYLRDNMAYELKDKVQVKGHNFAIVDEIDSILIDEARTPLIVSAPDEDSAELYKTFARIVPNLSPDTDYVVDEKFKTVAISESGIEKIEKLLGVANIYEEGGVKYVHHLEQALRAQVLYHRDKEYVVRDGEVVIVDEFTGRMMPGRRWSGGLHQAVEAKEDVSIQKESRTFATITFQNYFRLYDKLSGMTGTAQTSSEEFHKVYGLDVVIVPTNRPMIRKDSTDRIYKSEVGKFRALIEEVKQRNAVGQPILIGTTSINKNEVISLMLDNAGIRHTVLNAKNHEREAEIIAQAGKFGSVTVATNMAGRGVDIILGGLPLDPQEAEKVRNVGGLHVIGTERHEARRIDNQLRGRAGRQGDPGSSQFFVSAEDEVVRVFGGDSLKNLMDRLGVGDDDVIENSLVSRAIEQAQTKIEGFHFDSRKHVLEYDDVMSKHRDTVYKLRNDVLNSDDVSDRVLGYIDDEIASVVSRNQSLETGVYDFQIIEDQLKVMLDDESVGSIIKNIQEVADSESYVPTIIDHAHKLYIRRQDEIGDIAMRKIERNICLRVIDELWVDHLEQMEYLRDSVRLRAYGQRDPLIEYKIEGQRLYTKLLEEIGSQVAHLIFHVSVVREPVEQKNISENRDQIENDTIGNKSSSKAPISRSGNLRSIRQTVEKNTPDIGRNDLCPCGSGKKYKKCGLINAPEHKR